MFPQSQCLACVRNMQYLMRTDNDCGPAALSAAADVGYDIVMRAWPYGFGGNASDSPWHHDQALANLGLRRRICTLGEILDGKCPVDRTVILFHLGDRLQEQALRQHWVVLKNVSPTQVEVWNGQGPENGPGWWTMSVDDFKNHYAAASPACAYVVGEGSIPVLAWYQRAWLWLSSTRLIRSIMG